MRILLLSLGLCLLSLIAGAQGLPIPQIEVPSTDSLSEVPQLPADTLSPITMKVEPGLVAASVVAGVAGLPAFMYMGFHSYTINGRKRLNQRAVLPYFRATGDAQLMQLYGKHQEQRVIWYTATTGGLVLFAYGFAQLIVSIFDPSEGAGAATKLLLGGGLTVWGQVARAITFRKLSQAVDLYNYQYATSSRRVSLHLGLPSRTPAGGALYLRF
ncbi:hypothetical protein [Telluribacter sp. SYSU D00476]|uniref:hypothetical protein n=1 Tax=Telluribacter sp. SYSU D00476 TaxID=2811430 RepID=UPI001FF11844|nr:hypothetical protein [Telluribacter sp. SYSU D00476]